MVGVKTFLCLCLFLPNISWAELIHSTVISVYDGDTVTLATGDKIRLAGIDAPEIKQPFGIQSRDALRSAVLNKPVTVSWPPSLLGISAAAGPNKESYTQHNAPAASGSVDTTYAHSGGILVVGELRSYSPPIRVPRGKHPHEIICSPHRPRERGEFVWGLWLPTRLDAIRPFPQLPGAIGIALRFERLGVAFGELGAHALGAVSSLVMPSRSVQNVTA